MAEVVLLSDIVNNSGAGHSRYIGPYAVASSLLQVGIDVVVVDYFLKHPNFFEYIQNFIDSDTLAIGISSTFLSPREDSDFTTHVYTDQAKNKFFSGELFCHNGDDLKKWFAQLRSAIQTKAPNCKIVLGGSKAIRAIVNPDAYENVDYVCLGAGDERFRDFVLSLKNNIAIRSNEYKGKKLISEIRLKTDTGTGCPDAMFGKRFGIQQNESLPLEVSRGCLFNCKFCYYEKRTSIRKPLETLEHELMRNYELFGTTVYHITDDCFNDKREKIESICNLFLRLPFKIEWVSYARTDVAIKFPETMDMMVAAGARALFFGIESLNSEVARRAGKGTPVEQVKQFFLDFRNRFGSECLTQGSFIVGLPGEDRASILRTIDFLTTHDVLDTISVYPLEVLPYEQKLDMTVIDYAEYSKNPEKYGLTKISFDPLYWENEHMNSLEAQELVNLFNDAWDETRSPGGFRNIFNYPHLRTLGFSHAEIVAGYRRPTTPKGLNQEKSVRFKAFLSRYFDLLLKENSKSRVDRDLEIGRMIGSQRPKTADSIFPS